MAPLQKATRKQVKSHNKRLILKTIYDQGQISRAGLARLTRLTRPTVSSIVAELIDEGFVEEVGLKPSEGGKPATLLSVIEDSFHLIGIDLANSEFRGSIINLRGEIKHRFSLSVNDRNGEVTLTLVYDLIDELISVASRPLLGIGIGTPGLMDAEQGLVLNAVNLEWQNLPLGNLLSNRYNLPVYIANDSQVAALAEYIFGEHKDVSSLVVVMVGRGVGSGIVINGQLYFGDGSGAGEIGHMMIVPDGERCQCGHSGCLETVTSSRAIVKQAQAIAASNPTSLLHQFSAGPDTITTDSVLKAFEAGDRSLQSVIIGVGCHLGEAVAYLVGTLNIHHIIIAGSVARFGQTLLDPIKTEVQRRSPPMLVDKTCITLSSLGSDIVLLGAAALLLHQELGIV